MAPGPSYELSMPQLRKPEIGVNPLSFRACTSSYTKSKIKNVLLKRMKNKGAAVSAKFSKLTFCVYNVPHQKFQKIRIKKLSFQDEFALPQHKFSIERWRP